MLVIGRRAYIIMNSFLVDAFLQNQKVLYALLSCVLTEEYWWRKSKHPWSQAKHSLLDQEIKQSCIYSAFSEHVLILVSCPRSLPCRPTQKASWLPADCDRLVLCRQREINDLSKKLACSRDLICLFIYIFLYNSFSQSCSRTQRKLFPRRTNLFTNDQSLSSRAVKSFGVCVTSWGVGWDKHQY